jgi:hypothetical protein
MRALACAASRAAGMPAIAAASLIRLAPHLYEHHMSEAKKPAPDWERIEAQYRTGVASLREIAQLHGITEGAIRKRAKRDEWPRDLAAKVQAKADELVRREEVRREVRNETIAYREQEAVAVGAQMLADVKLRHKSTIRRMREATEAMLTELEAETGSPELFRDLIEFLRSDEEGAQGKRETVYHRAISMASRIDGLKKLADTLKVLIALEREAYGIQPAPQEINVNAKVRKADDLTDDELLAIAAGSSPGAADTPEGEG